MQGKHLKVPAGTMKVEIWSDVMCPFCYIGKRRFEQALEQFVHKDQVEVVWRSFQLNPDLPAHFKQPVHEYLAERKGITPEQALQMNAQVTNMAASEGLQYNFDKAVVANSFDAHRFSHLAASVGLGDAAEERLFKAYFTEGKNIADQHILAELGTDIGMDKAAVQNMLSGNTYAKEVHDDIEEAEALGIRGVPFFVLNRKYAVSGAQPAEAFLGALEQSFIAWKQDNPVALTAIQGDVCTPDGDCN
jgi:predicted DsbA family dithiol-disulfide isomerase